MTTKLPSYKPLISIRRGPVAEIVVYGSYFIKFSHSPVVGDGDLQLLTGSLLSPWQFLACEASAEDCNHAIGLAQHSGQKIHTEASKAIMQQAQITETSLFCPREYPLDPLERARASLAGLQPTRLFNPNSGKHLIMIESAKRLGLPIESYWDTQHPIQKKIRGLVGREAAEEISWTTDSCGLPTAAMSVRAHLNMWQKFAMDTSSVSSKLKQLWLQNPYLIGGYSRLDSELTQACKGKALIKEGSDGIFLIQSLPTANETVCSILIKLASGFNKAHIALLLKGIIPHLEHRPQIFDTITHQIEHKLDEWLKPNVKVYYHMD